MFDTYPFEPILGETKERALQRLSEGDGPSFTPQDWGAGGAVPVRQHQPIRDHDGEDEGEVPEGVEEELAGKAFAGGTVELEGEGDEEGVEGEGAGEVDPAETE